MTQISIPNGFELRNVRTILPSAYRFSDPNSKPFHVPRAPAARGPTSLFLDGLTPQTLKDSVLRVGKRGLVERPNPTMSVSLKLSETGRTAGPLFVSRPTSSDTVLLTLVSLVFRHADSLSLSKTWKEPLWEIVFLVAHDDVGCHGNLTLRKNTDPGYPVAIVNWLHEI